jgi:hypothetical protein
MKMTPFSFVTLALLGIGSLGFLGFDEFFDEFFLQIFLRIFLRIEIFYEFFDEIF